MANRFEHSFDWKGVSFSIKILLALAVIFSAAKLSVFITNSLDVPKIEAQKTTNTVKIANNTNKITPSELTPERIINTLTIPKAVPQTGKFIAADLSSMKLYLFQDGKELSQYPILSKGRPGTPWETPSGFYSIHTKEENHFSSVGKVYMPYSMQFFGNYFIHGWPYYPDGTPVASSYSGGCIRLSTNDARKVFEFADRKMNIFVYDSNEKKPTDTLALALAPAPQISALSYLVADADTGDVFLEQNTNETRPIASITKLMTALVANEVISFDKNIPISSSALKENAKGQDFFSVNDLLFPLIMESNNQVADTLADYYGKTLFINWMNEISEALDMQSTHFADASGASAQNTSTPDDLYRLAVYLQNKKSFIWEIAKTKDKDILAEGGTRYHFQNFNWLGGLNDAPGGKVGHTTAAKDTMLSLFALRVNSRERHIVIVILNSNDRTSDTQSLASWFENSAEKGTKFSAAACASCAVTQKYRKIEL